VSRRNTTVAGLLLTGRETQVAGVTNRTVGNAFRPEPPCRRSFIPTDPGLKQWGGTVLLCREIPGAMCPRRFRRSTRISNPRRFRGQYPDYYKTLDDEWAQCWSSAPRPSFLNRTRIVGLTLSDRCFRPASVWKGWSAVLCDDARHSRWLAPCGAHFRLYRAISSTLTTIRPYMAFRKSASVFRGGSETSVSRA